MREIMIRYACSPTIGMIFNFYTGIEKVFNNGVNQFAPILLCIERAIRKCFDIVS